MRVLLTGSSGFIGSHVQAALRQSSTARVRTLSRRPPATGPARAVEVHLGDLGDPRALARATDGVDVLIHCASYVGPSADTAQTTNVAGTQTLLAAAGRNQVRRIVYVSTAGVYGRGPFRCGSAASLPLRPASALSETRVQAEQLIFAAGGAVLRPHLVYGTGDRWVGPRAVALGRLVTGRVTAWDALVSAIDVRRLAAAAVALATRPRDDRRPQVYDCNHPEPVVAGACLQAFMAIAGVPADPSPLSHAEAQVTLRALGASTHDLDMLATDHWFASTRIWQDLQVDPGPPFATAVADHAAWYRALDS